MVPRLPRPKGDDPLVASAAAEIADIATEPPPAHRPKPTSSEGWWPKLGPKGRKLFLSTRRYILAHGPRYSGKTRAILSKIVKHCYENDDALAVIATIQRRSATQGGPWEAMLRFTLPEWQEGIGLQGEGLNGEFIVKHEQGTQTPMIWIGTANGGWSRVIMVSLQFGEHIMDKIRNMAYSLFYFNELGQTDSSTYFLDPIQQLRREGVPEKVYIADTNPPEQGEEHWSYGQFFKAENQENPDSYDVIFFPIEENVFAPDVPEYIATLKEKGKTDPTSWQRDGLGLWIKKPRGDGLFAKHFSRERHVRGDKEHNVWMLPAKKWPILRCGWDMGPVNPRIIIAQNPPNADGRSIYGVIDEIAIQRRPYRVIVQRLLKKLNLWCEVMDVAYSVQHVADSAAFNQLNSDGKYDFRVIAELATEELAKFADRYPRLGHIKTIRMHPCPKPPGSREARVSLMQSVLDADEIKVSAMCEATIAMFEGLEEDPNIPGSPLKGRDGHIHIHDALSYLIYHDRLGQRQPRVENQRAKAELIEVG